MKIHKEGYLIISFCAALGAIFAGTAFIYMPLWLAIPIAVAATLFLAFVLRFFRVPNRPRHAVDTSLIYSPADGTVVAIEEVYEGEYLKENRLQVSVFMSIWNVHINWYPIGGRIEYFRHHYGRFLVAWHPKSSTENERTTTVINTGHEKILFRQIAGFVARRIVNYASKHEGYRVGQFKQCGFIKFGSRVDLFLPLDCDLKVKLDDKVKGTQTPIARLNRK